MAETVAEKVAVVPRDIIPAEAIVLASTTPIGLAVAVTGACVTVGDGDEDGCAVTVGDGDEDGCAVTVGDGDGDEDGCVVTVGDGDGDGCVVTVGDGDEDGCAVTVAGAGRLVGDSVAGEMAVADGAAVAAGGPITTVPLVSFQA